MLLNTPIYDFSLQFTDFNLPDTNGRIHFLDSLVRMYVLLIALISNRLPLMGF